MFRSVMLVGRSSMLPDECKVALERLELWAEERGSRGENESALIRARVACMVQAEVSWS